MGLSPICNAPMAGSKPCRKKAEDIWRHKNMRKNYTVKINGKYFEAKHGERVLHMPRLTGATRLEEIYGTFSSAKEAAWYEWNEFYRNTSNNNCSFKISSHNWAMFTLAMVVYDEPNNQYWYLYITPAHNYAIKIDEVK